MLKRLFTVKAFLTGLTGCAVVGIAGVLGYQASTMQDPLLALESPVQTIQQFFVPDAQKVFGSPDLRVLVVGLDYDYDNLDQETSKNSRSDILMALHLDFAHKRISALSIPRDMLAVLPNGQRAKINQAQSDGGIKESQAVVAQWLGIPAFDRYVVLRINTAKDLINAVGGIDLKVENSDALKSQGANGPIDYDDNWGHLHVHLKPGYQHLNGDQAVGYARFRHDWCSDPCRIMRQQQVLHAIVDKIGHDKVNTAAHLQQLIAVVHNDVDTNFRPQEELAAAFALAGVPSRDIHTAQVPYVDSVMLPDYGDTLIPDEGAKRQLVASTFAEENEQTAAIAAIHVRVENGTDIPGLASRVADQLKAKGFTVTDVGNAPTTGIAVTEIHSDLDDTDASYRVRAALGQNVAGATVVPATDTQGSAHDITVVLGRDIVGENQ